METPATDPECPPRPAADPLGPEQAAALAGVLKALADPVRLRLLVALASADANDREAEVCVCHLPDVGVGQPTVSHHLRRLREAGLITSRRDGTWVYYALTDRGRDAAAALDAIRGDGD